MDKPVILIVDDDREIVGAIAQLLIKEDYECEKAYDGLSAVEKLGEREIHLIILDIMMPRLDGLSAMMKIRQQKNIR